MADRIPRCRQSPEPWQFDDGNHLWDYDHTTNPSPEFPFPTFNYKCVNDPDCGWIWAIAGLYSMEDCPHDVGYTFDPLSDGNYMMCMRCLKALDDDEEENKKQIELYFRRLFWCGPVCSDHGEVPWPV